MFDTQSRWMLIITANFWHMSKKYKLLTAVNMWRFFWDDFASHFKLLRERRLCHLTKDDE